MTTLLCLLATLVVIIALDWTVGRWLLGKINPRFILGSDLGKAPRSRTVLACLPGTMHSHESLTEIKPILREFVSRVLYLDYGFTRFDSEHVIRQSARAIGHKGVLYTRVILFGESMGGKVSAELILELESYYGWQPEDFLFLPADTPNGFRSFKLPGRTVSRIMSKTYAGPLTNLVMALVIMATFVAPMNRNIDTRLHIPTVKRDARKRAFKFWGSALCDQQRYLFDEWNGWLWMLKDVDAVYFECVGDNITVQQPQTARLIGNQLDGVARSFEIVQVPSTHCGFSEQPYVWMDALRDVLERHSRAA